MITTLMTMTTISFDDDYDYDYDVNAYDDDDCCNYGYDEDNDDDYEDHYDDDDDDDYSDDHGDVEVRAEGGVGARKRIRAEVEHEASIHCNRDLADGGEHIGDASGASGAECRERDDLLAVLYSCGHVYGERDR